MNNHSHLMNDPLFRQYQLERCREELRLYENYCHERNRHGCRSEAPRFNEQGSGNITNLPHHLRRMLPVFNPQQGYYTGNNINYSYQQQGPGEFYPQTSQPNQFRQQMPQGQQNNFSVCYTLSDDPNSPARLVFESFRNHPLVPNNLTPKHVIFVYEKPDSSPILPRNLVCTETKFCHTGVGDHSVVRYDVETQTQWSEVEIAGEKAMSPTDNGRLHLHNPINTKEATTSNRSEPDVPEFNMAVLKVAKWLHMTKNLGDVFNAPMPQKGQKKFGNQYFPSKHLQNHLAVQTSHCSPQKKILESTTKSKIVDATTAPRSESTEKADTDVASCAAGEQKDNKTTTSEATTLEKCSPPPSEPKQDNDQ